MPAMLSASSLDTQWRQCCHRESTARSFAHILEAARRVKLSGETSHRRRFITVPRGANAGAITGSRQQRRFRVFILLAGPSCLSSGQSRTTVQFGLGQHCANSVVSKKDVEVRGRMGEFREDRWPMSLASQLRAFPSFRHNGALLSQCAEIIQKSVNLKSNCTERNTRDEGTDEGELLDELHDVRWPMRPPHLRSAYSPT